MKRTKDAATKNTIPNISALEGIPDRNPHEEYVKKDADFKKSRGGKM